MSDAPDRASAADDLLDLAALRRRPDVEAENLFAVDAADRLLLDELVALLDAAVAAGRPVRPEELVVVGDQYGALALGAVAALRRAGAADPVRIRVHQDALASETALDLNAELIGETAEIRHHGLDDVLADGARVVVARLPRSLDALDEWAGVVARAAADDVTVLAGGRVKHMTPAMTEVLARRFGDVHATLARQKSRILVARRPFRDGGADGLGAPYPRHASHPDLGLEVRAHGAAFAGARVDIGTRFLLSFLADLPADARVAVDLGCGTGVIASAVALARPDLRVIATDQSWAAVDSARATVAANGVAERVTVVRDDAGSTVPDGSADLVLLNPPFHTGATVHAGLAPRLFAAAARMLRPGGQLWTVYNSPLGYRPQLTRIVGPTREAGRNAKFTVAVSTKPEPRA
ncbi:16S rRNA (guanine1207-N2)-methyltransferase [Clavibacter michiganensis]|uniref:class I SAM-dependent methyltransferase n=1 Tax=Clavibacter michiganensis TaxID=28447 RepID=UPI001AE95AF9|nr:class I SAM-dependent methyltransferase [Clavibacter michiganensis]MBP2456822.1 16S rRNA (guanine1207-N2)-methyltransferase [Clavibacter michiganensis]MDQ0409392.1 16S rRNA (guanine1207-N2)-methyltransferase [Clavibacter michiganensis]